MIQPCTTLCFDQWPFEGEQVSHKILIFVEELGLKARDENAPLGPDNPPYLDVIKATSIKVKLDNRSKA